MVAIPGPDGPRIPLVTNNFRPGDHDGVDLGLRAIAGDPPCDKVHRRVRICSKRNPLGFFNQEGAPVLAAGPGRVDRVWHQANGWWVRLRHEGNTPGEYPWRTVYGHLSMPSALVKDEPVDSGRILGVQGPGLEVKAPPHNPWIHLHFGVRGAKLKSWVNPARYLKRWRVLMFDREGNLVPIPFA